MPKVYRQKMTAVVFNGRYLKCIKDGSSYRVRPIGGEVQITEGTDGPGINIATKQGHIIEVTVREDSEDHEFIMDTNRNQAAGGPGVPLTMYMGTDRTFSADEVYVGAPGELGTGDKKMGAHVYTFVTKKEDLY